MECCWSKPKPQWWEKGRGQIVLQLYVLFAAGEAGQKTIIRIVLPASHPSGCLSSIILRSVAELQSVRRKATSQTVRSCLRLPTLVMHSFSTPKEAASLVSRGGVQAGLVEPLLDKWIICTQIVLQAFSLSKSFSNLPASAVSGLASARTRELIQEVMASLKKLELHHTYLSLENNPRLFKKRTRKPE